MSGKHIPFLINQLRSITVTYSCLMARCVKRFREGAGWDSDLLASIGQQLGTAESLELGRLANAHPPELLRYDPGTASG